MEQEGIMSEEIVARDLLEMLVCPLCKNPLELQAVSETSWGLRCAQCRKIYPVQDGIPIMLPEEALSE
jgi:hypothetical protein